jgi:dipeptidyl-peptidase 4
MLTIALVLAAATAAAPPPPSFKPLPLERIQQDPPLDGTPPSQLTLAPSGRFVAFLKANDRDSEVLDLWGARLPDGKPALLVATADLLGGAEQKLTEAERMALERQRISKRGITSYRWCGVDGTTLLFPLSGDLYFVKLRDGDKPLVEKITNDSAPEMVPQCSKSGGKVAFTKSGNVVVVDTQSKKARTLTQGASETRTFGLAEFIAEEEMDRHVGTWWSPDEKTLLVFEVDESPVAVKVRPMIYADRTEMFSQRYPAAGEKNAKVSAHLFDVKTGKKTTIKTPSEDGYLPRAGFFADGTPWIQWQSRDQKTLRLYAVSKAGVLSQILEDKDEAWVELHDDLRDASDHGLVWSSETTGKKQLELVHKKTGVRKQLTGEPEAVADVLAVDEKNGLVYFSGYRDRGRQLHVFVTPIAGGATRQLTTEEGWHNATFDKQGTFFLDAHSAWGTPPRTLLRDAEGKLVLVLDDNPAAELKSYTAPKPVWLDLPAADGKTVLNGVLLPPTRPSAAGAKTFEGKAPLIVALYGGPGTLTVAKRWARQYPLWAHWTAQGFGVLLVDNRGMAGRDRAFGRAHRDAFGDIEVKDVIASLQGMKRFPWFDQNRVGVWGWSYGGFLATRLVLDEHTPFACAAAGAPVTDWTLYDTHYTERYIGTPIKDGAPSPTYTSSNLVARAKLLNKPYLLLHGTADDNVLFEHALRLIEALQKESIPFDTAIYPGKAHGVSGKAAQLHVHRTVTSFFARCLKP